MKIKSRNIIVSALSVSCFTLMSVSALVSWNMNSEKAVAEDSAAHVSMIDGASVRIDQPTGLRFSAKLDKNYYDTLGTSKKSGILILPSSRLAAGETLTITTSSVLVVENLIWSNEDMGEYTAVLSDIPTEDYSTKITARAFIYDGSHYEYSAETMERSVAQVASLALQNGETGAVLEAFVDSAVVSFTVPESEEVATGKTKQLIATVNPSELAIEWSSLDETIATVDKNGIVSGVKSGTTTITAKLGTTKKTISLTVQQTVDYKVVIQKQLLSENGEPSTKYSSSEEILQGIIGSEVSYMPEAIEGYTTDMTERKATLATDTEIVVSYDLVKYTASITKKFGSKELGEETRNFYIVSEDIDFSYLADLTKDTYEYTFFAVDKIVETGTSENVEVIAEYSMKIYSAEQFMAIYTTKQGDENFILENDIDFSNYLAENPWSTNTSFLGELTGTLNGNGFGMYNIFCTAGVTQRWENSVFNAISGTLKNVYIEGKIVLRSGQNDSWSGLCEGATFAGSLTGTIENCILNIQSTYQYGNGESGDTECQKIGLFYKTTTTARMSNVLIYASNDKSNRLFSSDAYSEAENNAGDFENIVFIRPEVDKDNLLSNRYKNTAIRNLYIYSDLNKALIGDGITVSTEYATSEDKNGEALWSATTTKLSEVLSNITVNATSILLGENIVYSKTVFKNAFQMMSVLTADQVIDFTDWRGTFYKYTGEYVLQNDIDFTSYLKAYPWNGSKAFFSNMAGTLDGNGHAIKNIVCTAATQERWENSIFYAISGTVKNLYIEGKIELRSGQNDNWSAICQSSSFVGNLTGTIENCVINIKNTYKYGNGEAGDTECQSIGLCYTSSQSSKISNVLIYAANDKTTRLFTSDASSDASSNQGTYENIVFIRPSYDYAALLSEKTKNIYTNLYIYTSISAAETGSGKTLKAGYDTATTNNGEDLWEDSTVTANSVLTNISLSDGVLTFFNRTIAL